MPVKETEGKKWGGNQNCAGADEGNVGSSGAFVLYSTVMLH